MKLTLWNMSIFHGRIVLRDFLSLFSFSVMSRYTYFVIQKNSQMGTFLINSTNKDSSKVSSVLEVSSTKFSAAFIKLSIIFVVMRKV